MRFIRWLLTVMLLTALILLTIIVVARQDRTLTTLQRLGFNTCNGQLCYRGIALGTNRQMAQTTLKGRMRVIQSHQLVVDVDDGNLWVIDMTSDLKEAIDQISTVRQDRQTPLDITAGEVWSMLGAPCRVGTMLDFRNHVSRFVLVYPATTVILKSWTTDIPTPIVTSQPNDKIEDIWIMRNEFFGNCENAQFAHWGGFASSHTYQRQHGGVQLAVQP